MRPCEICGVMIDPERAEVLPETRLCTEHAKQIQKYGGEFTITSFQETTSKVGSLKKNYGGVNVSRRRNTDAVEKLKQDFLGD